MRTLAVLLMLIIAMSAYGRTPALSRLKTAYGWRVSVAVDRVPGVRHVAAARSVVYLHINHAILAVRDTDGNGTFDKRYTLYPNIQHVSAIAAIGNDLYIASDNTVLRADNVTANLAAPPKLSVVMEGVAAGTPLCVESGGALFAADDAGAILRRTPDGTVSVLARGVHEVQGIAVDVDGIPWFTDRSLLWGPVEARLDELNRVTIAGQHFGYPHMTGTVATLDIAPQPGLAMTLPEAVSRPGVRFGRVVSLGREIVVAERVAWSDDAGASGAVVVYADNASKKRVLLSGWARPDGVSWGEPLDMALDGGGGVFIADPVAGVVWRLAPKK